MKMASHIFQKNTNLRSSQLKKKKPIWLFPVSYSDQSENETLCKHKKLLCDLQPPAILTSLDALQASVVLGDSLRRVSQRDYYTFLL